MKFRKLKPDTEKEIAEESPSRRMWPSFHIGIDHLPEAKKWDMGKTYRLALEVEMTGLNIEEKEKYSDARFDIKGIAILPVPKKSKRYSE